jgi:hypothetical protein
MLEKTMVPARARISEDMLRELSPGHVTSRVKDFFFFLLSRSTDLKAFDVRKSCVFRTRPAMLEELKTGIREEGADVSQEERQKSVTDLLNKVTACDRGHLTDVLDNV